MLWGARAAGWSRSRGVPGLPPVLRFSLGRGPAAEPVHQPAGVVPVHPRAGDLLQVAQARDRAGAERRAVAGALGLVQADSRLRQGVVQGIPTVPTDGVSPASSRVWPNRTEVYCDPASL